jgi:hypothetical protein
MNMDHSAIKPCMVSLAQLQRQRHTERGCKKTGRQNSFLLYAHHCICQLSFVKSQSLSNGCTIKYFKKNVKIYIKINIEMLLHVSVQNDHYQWAWRLCFTKVINIKIVNWNISLENGSVMWLHSLSSPVCDAYSSLCSTRLSYPAQWTIHITKRTG